MIAPVFWPRACPDCGLLWRADLLDSPCPNCGNDPTWPQLPAPRRPLLDAVLQDIRAGYVFLPPTRLGIVGHWGNLIPLAGLGDEAARHWAQCEELALIYGLRPGEVAQIYQDEAAQLPWQITIQQALEIRRQKERRQLILDAASALAKTYAGAMEQMGRQFAAIGEAIAAGIRPGLPLITQLYSDLVRLGYIDPPAKPRRPRRVGGRKMAAPANRPAWKRQPKRHTH